MMKTAIRVLATLSASSLLWLSAPLSADEVVPVASLEVRERIRTIDQINVSAETEKVAETPSSAAVAQLLDEAGQLDNEAGAEVSASKPRP